MIKTVFEILEQFNLNDLDNGGTDKNTFHSYGEIYDEVLAEFVNKQGSLLEIGIQSGGSLLLWRTILKNFKIFGIDIKNNLHVNNLKRFDESIHVLFDDAYTVQTSDNLKKLSPNGFDIIIDDGPHTEESQLKCIELYLNLLNPDGVLIIEDILNFDFLEKLKKSVPIFQNFEYKIKVYDHRKKKNKIDDVIFMIKKTLKTSQPLIDLLNRYVFNSEDYRINFDLGLHYESIGQLSSAISYYLRSAERTNNLINQYESLIRTAMCFDRQKIRNFTVKSLLQNAVSICPTRPEAYYLLSKFYENEKEPGNWKDSFLIASIGEKVSDFNSVPLKTKIDYPGKYGLLYQKALSAWWCGLCHESRDIFNYIIQNYDLDHTWKNKIETHLEKFNETGKNLHPIYDKKEKFDWGLFKKDAQLNDCFKRDILDNKFYEKLFEVEEGDIVLDIGASVGPFTYSILNKNPKLAICLEPHLELFNTLQSNLSKCPNVICLNKGISKVDGDVVFKTLYDETTNYTSWEKNDNGLGITLATLMKEYNLEKIDFLKIDCEGGEYEFFTDENFNWITNNVKKISGEWHFYREDTRENFYKFREKYLKHFDNFKIFFIDNNSNLYDITNELWNEDFCQKYGWVNIYIDNRNPKIVENKTKIIDYCSFYGPYGSEMLLLRYHILKDYVDEFVISESSYSHTGIPVKFECKNKIKEWGLPEHKFKVIELHTPPDEELIIEEIDELNCVDYISGNKQTNLKSKLARVRDRLSKDALLKVLHEYDDNTFFIHGDIDEIINPKYIPEIINACKDNINGFTYIPLIYLEGRADLRVYNKTWNCPQAWDWAMFACSKSVLQKTTPAQIRSNKLIPQGTYSFYITDYFTNKPYADIGWHFSWMGGKESRLIKKQSWEHRYDSYNWLVTNSYENSDEFLNKPYKEGDIPPCGNVELELRNFPKEKLPVEIFQLPIVEKFLFPDTDIKETGLLKERHDLKDTEGYDLAVHIGENKNIKSNYVELIKSTFRTVLTDNTFVIPDWIIQMNGMSGKKYRNFINLLVSKINNPRYLEIGCWKGSTACSVLHSNDVNATFIDNWSQFGGPQQEFIDNISRCLTHNQNKTKVINNDFRKINFSLLEKFNIFLFDGPHEEKDHYDGLVIPYDSLDDEFIFICDDWNWSAVKEGTQKAIQKLNLNIVYSIEIAPTKPEGHGLGGEFSDWHNGYFIAVCKKQEHTTLKETPMQSPSKTNKKIVDFFPYFDPYGRELLEFRIKLFQDYVDEFVICESNKTQSGIPIEYNLKQVIEDLKLPKEKIRVIQLEIPEDNELEIHDIDRFNAVVYGKDNMENLSSLRARVRERLQKDSLLQIIDDYDDDTVFVVSDSDEIINPQLFSWVPDIVRQYQDTALLRIPLVHLEGRADRRVYDTDKKAWFPWLGAILCTKLQLKKVNPHRLRANFRLPFENSRLIEDDKILEDLGWHFSWMGGLEKRNIKMRSWTHHDDVEGDSVIKSWANGKKNDIINKLDLNVNDTAFSGTGNLILKEYPSENLPGLIFNLPNVKEFLLPSNENLDKVNQILTNFKISQIVKPKCWIVENFYEDPDAVRKFALEQQYVEGGFGRGFIGRRTEKQYLFPGLKEKFEQIMGMKISAWESHGMNGRFQNCYSGEPLVYHCDSQTWAGMLYLTPNAPYQTGTTLHGHKVTKARSFYDLGWDESWKNMPGDPHLDRTPFEPVDVLGNVYNRLVIFDASAIHSASEYFGTVMENSRLWQMFFFD